MQFQTPQSLLFSAVDHVKSGPVQTESPVQTQTLTIIIIIKSDWPKFEDEHSAHAQLIGTDRPEFVILGTGQKDRGSGDGNG